VTRDLHTDPVAGIHARCLLCGGQAHAYTADDGHTVEVWDLCRRCNDAFVELAAQVTTWAQPAPAAPAVEPVPGQLDLDALIEGLHRDRANGYRS
jgi:hypothetical protein